MPAKTMTRAATPLLLSASLLGACATTEPLEAAGVTYRLPRTDAVATLKADLRGCDPLEIELDLDLEPKAGADMAADRAWRLPASALASTRIKRGLKVTVDKRGVISGVNSEVSDRTAQIVGNSIKTVATLAAAAVSPFAAGAPGGQTCSDSALAAVRRRETLIRQIDSLRGRLADNTGDPRSSDRATVATLNRLARELGALSSQLHIEAVGLVKLDAQAVPTARFDEAAFDRWFADPKPASTLFPLTWTATAAGPPPSANSAASRKRMRPCGLSMKVPNPVLVRVKAEGRSGSNAEGLEASLLAPAAQWSSPADLCLDVGFGESRSVGLAFDDYGRTTEFTWNSEATSETVSAAIAGAAPDVVSLIDTIRGPNKVARQKTEIEELETQKALNELRACQTIIAAGGFDCAPSE